MLLTMWGREKPGVLFVTHEIDEALTVATRIAVLTPRPTTIQTWYTLPGAEGREHPPRNCWISAGRSSGKSRDSLGFRCAGRQTGVY